MITDNELIVKTFKNSSSIYEVMQKLHMPNKGKTSKYIKNVLLQSGITVEEIKNKKVLKTRISKKCKYCGKIFYVSKIGRRSKQLYCSHSCANHRNHSEISKEKTKSTIKNTLIKKGKNIVKEKICPICGNIFNKKSITCSVKCGQIHRVKMHPVTIETRKKLSDKVQKRIAEGKHKGWTTRNIESYPEKFFKKVLENNNIDYEFNKPITKNELGIQENGCYFLDFALKNNIDLEIDGKQHLVKERHQHDIVRDNRLKKNGWKVYRIAWKALPKNNEYIKNEIDKFIEWYNIIQKKEGNYDND